MQETDRKILRAAISPCPNDTFIFQGLITGALTLQDADIDWIFEDVETLNRAAFSETYDITKLSFHAYLMVRDKYRLLRAGAALGFGCGPVAISREPVKESEISSLRIALPGELTTAHLLFRLFCPKATDKRFVRYDEIIPAVKNGKADIGVIIHEDRFIFEAEGLQKVADLGSWWETTTGAPIPLGCIAMRRSSADRYADAFEDLVRKSILLAKQDLPSAMPLILQHAKQMDPKVLRQHIETFVTDFSMDLGPVGDRAVGVLERMAQQAGIYP